MLKASLYLLLLTALMSPLAQASKPQFNRGESATKSDYPFSEAVRVGDLLFLAGKLGTKPDKGLVKGGIKAETAQTMKNIKAVLERNGSNMDNVVKCTVFLADMNEWGKMNAVYRTFFNKNYPARSALGASGLALGARVEIECIAAIVK